ncbi:MAG: YceI family protein [Pseudomonadota bacterium]
MRLCSLLLCFFALIASGAVAAPQSYLLDTEQSRVRYEVDFGPDIIDGTMPVSRATVVVDFDTVANSQVDVTLSPGGATASFPFAAQALRGPKVLATDEYPDLTFVSSSVRPEGTGAIVTGDITIRDVTRPIALNAQFFRPQGTQQGDRRELWIEMTGAVSRSAFGADGWSDLVQDEVRLRILARITRAEE